MDTSWRRINVNCVAFLFEMVSLLLSMDKTFKSVISSPKEMAVRDGSITGGNDWNYIEGKLIQSALNISQKMLLWSSKNNDLSAIANDQNDDVFEDVHRMSSGDAMSNEHGDGDAVGMGRHLMIKREGLL